jgi:hypothetical protein
VTENSKPVINLSTLIEQVKCKIKFYFATERIEVYDCTCFIETFYLEKMLASSLKKSIEGHVKYRN